MVAANGGVNSGGARSCSSTAQKGGRWGGLVDHKREQGSDVSLSLNMIRCGPPSFRAPHTDMMCTKQHSVVSGLWGSTSTISFWGDLIKLVFRSLLTSGGFCKNQAGAESSTHAADLFCSHRTTAWRRLKGKQKQVLQQNNIQLVGLHVCMFEAYDVCLMTTRGYNMYTK